MSTVISVRSALPIPSEFLRRNAGRVYQKLVLAPRKDALQVTQGDLALTATMKCGFFFNCAFDGSKLEYAVLF